ncbi:MAG: hypothetical protein ACK5JT_17195 [Hyphomicrobiaceae bacterium]
MRDGWKLAASSAVIVTLGLGLWLKVDRYWEPDRRAHVAFDRSLLATFEAAGWRRINPQAHVVDPGAYRAFAFMAPGCKAPLNVIMVGYTANLGFLLQRRFGVNVTLVENGREVQAFNPRKLQFDRFLNQFGRHIGMASEPVSPLLAINPTLGTWAQQCPGVKVPVIG